MSELITLSAIKIAIPIELDSKLTVPKRKSKLFNDIYLITVF